MGQLILKDIVMQENHKKYITEVIEAEANRVKSIFYNEIKLWERSAKVLIIGEAPLSSNRYFYKQPGNFLKGFDQYYNLAENDNIIERFRNTFLVIDIFRYPLPTLFYEESENALLDLDYLSELIADLKKGKIIDENTSFVFRYKKLRTFYENFLKQGIRPIHDKQESCFLFENEYGKRIINQEIIENLPKILN
jgi:hypothetical protein